ncbi:MAG: peptide chain release factor aRF-1, partial [Candidatus Helarchaeota archaeon]
IDRSGMTIATLSRNKANIIKQIYFTKAFQRYQTDRKYIHLNDYIKPFFIRAGKLVNNQFLNLNLKGLIIGGFDSIKEFFIKSDYLNNQLKEKIIALIDVNYSGVEGINMLIEKSRNILKK